VKISQLLLVAAALLACGCDNPKAANNKNFSKAITTYLTSQEELGTYCVGPKTEHFQEETVGVGETNSAFVKLGFLKIVNQYPTMMGFWTMTVYDMTPEGHASFTPGKGFCMGHPELVQVVNFTDPGPNGTMSRVTYSYHLTNIANWASGSGGQTFRRSVPGADGVVQTTATFVLTGNGWAHESLAPH